MNIYELSQELLSIFDEIEENGGEITPEIEEKLIITEQSFKDKIKDYTNVIKVLQNDIAAIKDEKERLDSLKKSKEKTIERLKQIIITAIEQFGATSKAGAKFIDYGTGKVSIRNSQAVEIDENITNRFMNRYVTALTQYDMMNQLDLSIINGDELLEFVNTQSPDEYNNDIEITKLTDKDLETLKAVINLDISFKDLISTPKGFALAKALIKYNDFEIKSKADKTEIKRQAKLDDHYVPGFAKIVNNKTITIK